MLSCNTIKYCKKPLAATVALLLAAATSFAQELAITSFKEDESDQAARITSPVEDKNGKKCALIKLLTNLKNEDFTFDAGLIGIEKIVQKNGAVWIYLPRGAKRISIFHNRFEKGIANYEFPNPLKEGTVYMVQLQSAKVKVVVEESLDRNHFVVSCTVEGATLSIDGGDPEPFGSGGMLDKILTYGKHTYTVEAGKWYHPKSGFVVIAKGEKQKESIALEPKFGKLTVTTTPEDGADIFIDGDKQEQKSPTTISRILSGEHTIRAAKEFYKIAVKTVTIADKEEVTAEIPLQPNFAEVTLTSPQGGVIFVDDVQKGVARWSGKLIAGSHSLEVQKKSHRPRKLPLDVVAGKNQVVTLPDMEPVYGNLDVSANVVDAMIAVDGYPQNAKTPHIFENLLIGEHTITLTANGYKPATKSVEVVEGKLTHVKIDLQEAEKIARINIRSNVTATVVADGKTVGTTPVSIPDVPLSKKR
ncbi:MAG: PEGA domain-containing protein [Prevotellaceae bacterium]|jgi:hypothetical protein|nr:PEGA domain-containing protein [Prevotellaceae bacterium]